MLTLLITLIIDAILLLFMAVANFASTMTIKNQSRLIDQLWRAITPVENQKENMPTETQKVAEIQAAYDNLKAQAVTINTQIAALNQQVADLQQQVANGTPVTADQIAALAAVDTLDAEVEADTTPAAPASPATASTPPSS